MERTSTFCGYCGTAVMAASPTATAVMVHAVSAPVAYAQPALAQPAFAGMPGMGDQGEVSTARPMHFPDLPPYYQEAFATIAAGGRNASKNSIGQRSGSVASGTSIVSSPVCSWTLLTNNSGFFSCQALRA